MSAPNRYNFNTGGIVDPFEGMQKALAQSSSIFDRYMEREEARAERKAQQEESTRRWDIEQARLANQDAESKRRFEATYGLQKEEYDRKVTKENRAQNALTNASDIMSKLDTQLEDQAAIDARKKTEQAIEVAQRTGQNLTPQDIAAMGATITGATDTRDELRALARGSYSKDEVENARLKTFLTEGMDPTVAKALASGEGYLDKTALAASQKAQFDKNNEVLQRYAEVARALGSGNGSVSKNSDGTYSIDLGNGLKETVTRDKSIDDVAAMKMADTIEDTGGTMGITSSGGKNYFQDKQAVDTELRALGWSTDRIQRAITENSISEYLTRKNSDHTIGWYNDPEALKRALIAQDEKNSKLDTLKQNNPAAYNAEIKKQALEGIQQRMAQFQKLADAPAYTTTIDELAGRANAVGLRNQDIRNLDNRTILNFDVQDAVNKRGLDLSPTNGAMIPKTIEGITSYVDNTGEAITEEDLKRLNTLGTTSRNLSNYGSAKAQEVRAIADNQKQESVNTQVATLKGLLDQGKIPESVYNQAVAGLVNQPKTGELRNPSIAQLSDAEKAYAQSVRDKMQDETLSDPAFWAVAGGTAAGLGIAAAPFIPGLTAVGSRPIAQKLGKEAAEKAAAEKELLARAMASRSDSVKEAIAKQSVPAVSRKPTDVPIARKEVVKPTTAIERRAARKDQRTSRDTPEQEATAPKIEMPFDKRYIKPINKKSTLTEKEKDAILNRLGRVIGREPTKEELEKIQEFAILRSLNELR